MGSETPHQMGWYWVTLATEYELLRRNGQIQEAQRTLEELFLGLQAYRRLDMQAQCMAQKRYEEITADYEVESCQVWGFPNGFEDCLCGEKYWAPQNRHSSFGVPCKDNCTWEPDLSGYSGFFLREDATQTLEILHDPSEDRYNIDMVSSDFAMSQIPPCTANFSQPCYLAHRQDYMSQDGVTGLMIGLALIKKYIPENAEVTTCDGATFRPLQMAKTISNAIVNRIDDAHNNRIFFPGSDECCAKKITLSNFEGGHASSIIHGLKKSADYIDDQGRHSNVGEYIAWEGLRALTQATINSNAKFWLRLKTLGWDMGEERPATKTLFNSAIETQNLEILALINNLLYPAGDNLETDQAFFADLLCKAPCGGPCQKRSDFGEVDPEIWPEFECPNNPEWLGMRWETNGFGGNRLFNGLDYMALYNIYMLHYGEPVNGYYNPERPQGIVAFGDNTLINGPDVLCPVSIGNYEIRHNYNTPLSWTFLSDIEWSTSANLEVISTSLEEADIRANSGLNPSFVQVSYNETRSLDQYYATPLGENWPLSQISTLQTNGDFVDDKCFFTARKPVVTTSDAYYFTWEADHCQGNYQFHAEGGVFENVSFNWTLEVLGSSTIITLQGKDPSLCCSQLSGQIMRVTLTVSSECGEYVSVNYVYYYCYGSGPNLRATPNPAQDYIAVNIINGEDESFYNITDPSGVRIRINPAYGGTTVMDTQIHANGESIMVSNLQNGVYDLEASATDFAIPLHTTIVIAR